MSGLELAAPTGLRLVLIRHGQTPANVARVLDTLPPGPGLTELGQQQAAELAVRLAEEKIVSIHASRAIRAQETAQPLAQRHELPVEVVEGTHEVYAGDLERRGDPEALRSFHEVYSLWHGGELDVPMPGGETGREALTRFVAGARSAIDGAGDGSVALVSHGAMLRLAAAALASNVDGATADSVFLPNTGVIVLESDPEAPTGWTCKAWDGLPTL
ncbi:probable phosphoglycerate mutase [Saccharopolyspora kobensis]|uniref:Probable phosphoglycerate mutase n=1 Tax=Saccharopolyspora kobensis TaxID=146035 RepID=A0A1H6DF60_9PSEU|nr:histidine phosphatase family protein [Saccharopolyspora kobensis]SEG84077.1 probable phosphoglycerate mutase [Saccharopolyspora kobensis]SFD29805.1 probable phosphoglycerate mutase [Saccharopolyspora kobensis]